MGAPFILPVIVAVLGLLAVFGRAGVLNDGLAALGLPRVSIYGPRGVVLAHVFFNLPLAHPAAAARLAGDPGRAVPPGRVAGLHPRATSLRHLEAPMLRATLPGAWLAIFLICLTSFAVALTLGGGPRATTIELAIYQAFRFDFDLGPRGAAGAAAGRRSASRPLAAAARMSLPAGLRRRARPALVRQPGAGGAGAAHARCRR